MGREKKDRLRAHRRRAGWRRVVDGEAHRPACALEQFTLWLVILYHTLVTFRLSLG
jgi:hypothetical protein